MIQCTLRFLTIVFLLAAVLPSGLWASSFDRGLVALTQDDGSVYITWRLFASDSVDCSFVLKRDDGVTWETDLCFRIDYNPPMDKRSWSYKLYKQDSGDMELCGEVSYRVGQHKDNFIRVPFDGNHDAQKVGIGDLDGDGEFEYVIKQPNFNTDPYQQPGYWKKSTTTYKLEAYETDGTLLWRYDMGWSIEAGIWYSPWLVYDVDQDGKAEVYTKAGVGDPREPSGQVKSGPEYLVKLDGKTGKVIQKTNWISRDHYSSYNYYSRNFLSVAYLDGKNPSLVIQRGTYKLIMIRTLDADFNIIWTWEATGDNNHYRGQSAHGLTPADVDNDGKDELVIGAAVIDDNGDSLWSLDMGHPDIFYVGDMIDTNPGLEVYYGFESRQKTDGICLVDARTGTKLWAHKEPSHHLHAQGMAADVLAEYPGVEFYCGERDYDVRWFYSATGKLIKKYEGGTLSPRPVWWDADLQKEVIVNRAIRDWDEDALTPIRGKIITIADCVGDWREEVLTCLDGELRIYTTTIPANTRKPWLMQNRQYRTSVTGQTMGYFYPPHEGFVMSFDYE